MSVCDVRISVGHEKRAWCYGRHHFKRSRWNNISPYIAIVFPDLINCAICVSTAGGESYSGNHTCLLNLNYERASSYRCQLAYLPVCTYSGTYPIQNSPPGLDFQVPYRENPKLCADILLQGLCSVMTAKMAKWLKCLNVSVSQCLNVSMSQCPLWTVISMPSSNKNAPMGFLCLFLSLFFFPFYLFFFFPWTSFQINLHQPKAP